MKKVFINLNRNNIVNGWTAGISNEFALPDAKSSIAMDGGSPSYVNKQQAWETIANSASKIDYINKEVFFNHKSVSSYEEVVSFVNAL
jgi:hypothetical protein